MACFSSTFRPYSCLKSNVVSLEEKEEKGGRGGGGGKGGEAEGEKGIEGAGCELLK